MEGNQMKMREALVEARKVIKAMGGYWARITLPIIDAAIAAPARNCDVYKTPEDCMRAFESYVREHGKLGFINPFTEVVKWLLAQAAERNGKGDVKMY